MKVFYVAASLVLTIRVKRFAHFGVWLTNIGGFMNLIFGKKYCATELASIAF